MRKLPKKLQKIVEMLNAKRNAHGVGTYHFGFSSFKAISEEVLRATKYPELIVIGLLEDMKKDFCFFVDKKIVELGGVPKVAISGDKLTHCLRCSSTLASYEHCSQCQWHIKKYGE